MSVVAAKKAVMAALARGGTKSSSESAAQPSPSESQESQPLLADRCDNRRRAASGGSYGYVRRGSEADDLESQTSTLGAPSDRHCPCGRDLSDCRKNTNEAELPRPSSSSLSLSSSSSTSSTTAPRFSARLISDATIGLSDGLTVPFALTAGLSALDSTRIVIYGGLAELIAGAISMGLGGYLGAKSEVASYKETLSRTNQMITTDPQSTEAAVRSVFEPYDLRKDTLDELSGQITASPDLAEFLMKFQHCENEPSSSRAFMSGLTIALGYFLGGLLPLLPYFFVAPEDLQTGLLISVAVMAVALFSFGYAKTCMVSGWRGSRNVREGLVGGVQMVVVGGAAAAAAMLLVKFFNSLGGEEKDAGGG